MRLRKKKRTSNSPRVVLAGVISVLLLLTSLAALPGGGRSWREVRLGLSLSAAPRAELAAIVHAAGGAMSDGAAGQVAIRLDGPGPLPPSLVEWAHRTGTPLPVPASGTTIGSAEAVFCAKDSPTAAAAMAVGPALTGQVDMASRPAWRPFEQLADEPCLPPLILAEHLAGRSPPRPVIG
jgi:hypothetical protein